MIKKSASFSIFHVRFRVFAVETGSKEEEGGRKEEEGVTLSFAHVNETLNYVYNLQRINCSLLMEVKREV